MLQIDAAINPGNSGGRCTPYTLLCLPAILYSAYLPYSTLPEVPTAVSSSGPVFDPDGKVIGVAFAGLDEADNIGYVIPMPVIQLFLMTFERQGCIVSSQ